MKTIITDIKEVVGVFRRMEARIPSLPYRTSDDPVFILKGLVDNTREDVIAKKFQKDWRELFILFGAVISVELLSTVAFIPEEFAAFLLEKHKLYGAEPFEDWKEVGIIMRLGSKISRLTNLKRIMNRSGVDDTMEDIGESAIDTTKDILGYCILGYYLDRL